MNAPAAVARPAQRSAAIVGDDTPVLPAAITALRRPAVR